MYTLHGHAQMIADPVRMDAYAQAIRTVVRPGSVVADLGTGTGLMAVLACIAGARMVYAIEPDESIHIARQIARANGFADRIVFIQDLSTRVALPEPVDVVISDMRGVLPLHGGNVASVIDARTRFLAPQGVMVPGADTLWAVPVQGVDMYRPFTGAVGSQQVHLDLGALTGPLAHTWVKTRRDADRHLGDPQCWATLDYQTVGSANVAGSVSWTVAEEHIGHGLLVWFETTLVDGIGYSTGPGRPPTVYGHAFFPWSTPVMLEVADVIDVDIHADVVGDDYVWRWRTRVTGADGGVKTVFEQSTFLGSPLSSRGLARLSRRHAPALNGEGEVARFVLTEMGKGENLGAIADKMRAEFPGRFADETEALTQACRLSLSYGRADET